MAGCAAEDGPGGVEDFGEVGIGDLLGGAEGEVGFGGLGEGCGGCIGDVGVAFDGDGGDAGLLHDVVFVSRGAQKIGALAVGDATVLEGGKEIDGDAVVVAVIVGDVDEPDWGGVGVGGEGLDVVELGWGEGMGVLFRVVDSGQRRGGGRCGSDRGMGLGASCEEERDGGMKQRFTKRVLWHEGIVPADFVSTLPAHQDWRGERPPRRRPGRHARSAQKRRGLQGREASFLEEEGLGCRIVRSLICY